MDRETYIGNLLKTYAPVAVLSEKNGCRVLRLRHKTMGKDIVLHSLPTVCRAYEILHTVRSVHLPLVLDTVELEDGQIVLEEYIEGMTVAQVMETGRYRPYGARKVISAVCDALAVMHERGIVHRDVKPENVMITPMGRVVLIDFNASRQVSAASHDTVILGTVGYASPEQMGLTQSDARTDIYALGVLYNVMLTGEHPSVKIAGGRAGRVIRKCTAIHPADRFPSVTHLADAL